jgi:hypothetical protein
MFFDRTRLTASLGARSHAGGDGTITGPSASLLSATMVDGEPAKEEDDVETSVRLALEASPDDSADVAFQLESAEIEVIALPFQ